jgi:ribonuclease-3
MMNPLEQLRLQLKTIEALLGYSFENKDFLINALTHRSYANEHRESTLSHNERLEFLGDSVLGLAVAEYLYHRLPLAAEGELSQIRSKLVEAITCAKYSQKLKIQDFILLGRGEKLTEGRNKVSILADAFEAIVGAIFLDGGMQVATSFLICHFEEEALETIGTPPRNFKAELQDYSQKKFQKVPVYQVVQESGPDHAKSFHVVAFLNEKEVGVGVGASKKEAEQRAAFEAISSLTKELHE